jgi:hypothetical protein
MNDFDRLLESQLRRFLDRVVAVPVPVRRTPKGLRRTNVVQSVLVLALAPETMVAIPVEVHV